MGNKDSLDKRCIKELISLGYRWIPPAENRAARSDLKNALLKGELISSIQQINSVDTATALAVYRRLIKVRSNEDWVTLLRGGLTYLNKETQQRQLIRLIDFRNLKNNRFTVTNRLLINSPKSQVADMVIYANGIPVVVMEVENTSKETAFRRLQNHFNDIPRLFFSNLFCIAVRENNLYYGVPGETLEAWGVWKDPWPKSSKDFNNPLSQQLFSLLSPSRLLDILRNFIFFEKMAGRTLKRVCRYQQYQAVNMIVAGFLNDSFNSAVVQHAQGSGRSISMVFLALKLGLNPIMTDSQRSPAKILVLTKRRKFLDRFEQAVSSLRLEQPKKMNNRSTLSKHLQDSQSGAILLADPELLNGLTFSNPVSDWYLFIDEFQTASQKDCVDSAFKILSKAKIVGFSSAWVNGLEDSQELMTSFSRFDSVQSYSAEQAISDGVTVPLSYMSRQSEWHVRPHLAEELFNDWYSKEPRVVRDALQHKGLSETEIAKCPHRIKAIAKDIWAHYQEYLVPNGLKAQLITVDSEAAVLYKRAIEAEAKAAMRKRGFPSRMAAAHANLSCACVFASKQSDRERSNNAYIQSLRQDLLAFATDIHAERKLFHRFCDRNDPLGILISSDMRFQDMDAAAVSVIYLDAPLVGYDYLRAIGRANRILDEYKSYGLLIDYFGVTASEDRGLKDYADTPESRTIFDTKPNRARLLKVYNQLSLWLSRLERTGVNLVEIKAEFDQALEFFHVESQWEPFKKAVLDFVRAYESLVPDYAVTPYTGDLKWVLCFMAYAEESRTGSGITDLLRDCSPRTYQLLMRHIEVMDISSLSPIPRERELKQLPAKIREKASSQ